MVLVYILHGFGMIGGEEEMRSPHEVFVMLCTIDD